MTTANPTTGNGRSIRSFVRHYAEMVAAMVIGMLALSMPADHLLQLFGTSSSDQHPTVMIISMAVTMTVPMVAWMRYRGHGWQANAEMAAAMIAPTFAAICLLRTGVLTGTMSLMTIEHAAMLGCMLVAMLLRFDEYSGASHGHHGAQRPVAA